MSPEHVTLKPIRAELHYRGNYRDNAFELLTAPVQLYRSLLKQLGQFGASLQSIKWESPSLADSHVVCGLAEMNVAIRVRIDRIEIDFWRLHESGTEIASRIVLATWAAVREADISVETVTHVVDIIVIAEVPGDCSSLMSRYVKSPDAVGTLDFGVAFYSRPVQKNQKWINVILERVFKEDRQLLVKVVMGLDSQEVTVDSLAVDVESYMTATLDKLGLRFGTDNQK
jgi:hypothetical protein